MSEDEEPSNFVVRFSPEARLNALTITQEMPTASSAIALYREFEAMAGKLAFLPERHMVQQELSEQLGRTVRRLLVRRWNLYYEVVPDSLDGPMVKILFIRDSRLPLLTQEEADQIQTNL